MVVQGDRARWLVGEMACCSRTDVPPARALRLVLLGAPGVGKGTQAAFLAERLQACHLSTGDIFRHSSTVDEKDMTEALRLALEAMRRGELVSDDTVAGIVAERLHCLRCTYGFLLDGFPRTIEQAIELENLLAASNLELDAVVDYVLDTQEIVARLSGRRTCRGCKATFHVVSKPPQVDGICDLCGGELFQRDDDSPESIQVRLEAYEKSTRPLKDFFKGKVVSVSAEGSPEEIFDRTLEAFSHRGIF